MTLSGCWVPCHVGVSMGMLTTWPLASLGVSHLGDYLVLEMKAVACYDLISRVACPCHLPLVTQANPGTVGWGAMNQERETIGDHSGDCPPQTDSQKKKMRFLHGHYSSPQWGVGEKNQFQPDKITQLTLGIRMMLKFKAKWWFQDWFLAFRWILRWLCSILLLLCTFENISPSPNNFSPPSPLTHFANPLFPSF